MRETYQGIVIDGSETPVVNHQYIKSLEDVRFKGGSEELRAIQKRVSQLPDGPLKNWKPERFPKVVKVHLDKIMENPVGAAVMRAIKKYGDERIVIKPEVDALGVIKASQSPIAGRNLEQNGCLRPGKKVFVRFTPGHYVPGSKLYSETSLMVDGNGQALPVKMRALIGYQADEVLLHELVHALLKVRCFNNVGDISFPAFTHGYQTLRFDNVEEFYTILIANIYLSAKNEAHGKRLLPPGAMLARDEYFLVKDHSARDAGVGLTNPRSLAEHDKVAELIRELARYLSEFCVSVSRVSATFNPIREVLRRSNIVPRTGVPSERSFGRIMQRA